MVREGALAAQIVTNGSGLFALEEKGEREREREREQRLVRACEQVRDESHPAHISAGYQKK